VGLIEYKPKKTKKNRVSAPILAKYLKYPKIKIEFQKTAFFSVVKILIDIVFSNNFQTIYSYSIKHYSYSINPI
tara:strand:- start:883 stop:1104 length:222 start_codon:yes stop_codon:yes gene_type:complete